MLCVMLYFFFFSEKKYPLVHNNITNNILFKIKLIKFLHKKSITILNLHFYSCTAILALLSAPLVLVPYVYSLAINMFCLLLQWVSIRLPLDFRCLCLGPRQVGEELVWLELLHYWWFFSLFCQASRESRRQTWAGDMSDFLTKNPARSLNCLRCQVHSKLFERFPRL